MPTRKVTPVVGLPQFDGWSHVVNYHDAQGSQLVAAFAVSGKQAGNLGRSLTETITSAQIYQAADLDALVGTLLSEAEINGCSLYFAGGMLRGTAKGCFAAYQGTIQLKRGDKIGQVVKATDTLMLVSGLVKDDDIFVFATNPTAVFLSEISQKFSQGYEVDTIITSIVPGIHGQRDSSLSSLAFVTGENTDDLAATVRVDPDDTFTDEQTRSNGEQTLPVLLAEQSQPQQVSTGLHWQPASDAVLDALSEQVKPAPSGVVKMLRTIFRLIGSLVARILALIVAVIAGIGLLASVLWNAIQTTFLSRAAVQTPLASDIQGAARVPGDARPTSVSGPTLKTLTSKNRRTVVVAAIIVAIGAVLVVTIYLTISRRQSLTQAADELVAPIRQENQAAAAQVANNPLEARTTVADNIQELQRLRQEHEGNSIAQAAISTELSAAEALLESISGQDELDELVVFYDLRLVQSDFVASIAKSDGTVATFADTQSNSVLLLDLASKQVRLVDSPSNEAIRDVTVQDGAALLLANGIERVDMDREGELESLVTPGDSNRTGTLLAAFDRFIYVLNPEKRILYRYAETDGEYSDPIGWFRSNLGIDFETIKSIAIDGDVWLGTQTGEIKRFTSGEDQAFTIQGLPTPFENPILVSTSSELEHVYVLDPEQRRIVVLNKDGVFVRQVESSSLASATSIFVSESLQKAFAVSGSIVFEIPL